MKSLLTILLLTLPVAAQDTQSGGSAQAQNPTSRSSDADPALDGFRRPVSRNALLIDGGVEAPAQPTDRSSATWTIGQRPVLRSSAGRVGRINSRVRSLVAVRGREENPISGYGLIVGLAGTGDSGGLVTEMLHNVLLTHNINMDPKKLKPENLAVVHVEAMLPAGMKPGQLIDARVSAIGDATSLVNGNLVMCELFDAPGETVYAIASGPLTVGGFTVSGESATATKNHTTVGILPSGAIIQREVPTRVVSENGYIYLDAKKNHASYGNMVRIGEAVNRLYPGVATTMPDGKTVMVGVPEDLPESQYVAYLDTILQLEVETDNLALVVINERTGTITMGGDVRLRPGVMGHGSIFVTVAETPQVSQPGPLSRGRTQTIPRTNLQVYEENQPLVAIPGAATLEEVVDVLNVLGTTPRDMISILIEMSESGILVADIRRM